MSDYCKDCSLELFNKDYQELAHNSLGFAVDICEGCGYIAVDNDGKRVSECYSSYEDLLSNLETDKVFLNYQTLLATAKNLNGGNI